MIAESAQGEQSEVERNCDQSARGLMPPAAGVRDARHLHRSILLLPGLMLAAAIAALLLALATGGGATPQALDDPGPVIRRLEQPPQVIRIGSIRAEVAGGSHSVLHSRAVGVGEGFLQGLFLFLR